MVDRLRKYMARDRYPGPRLVGRLSFAAAAIWEGYKGAIWIATVSQVADGAFVSLLMLWLLGFLLLAGAGYILMDALIIALWSAIVGQPGGEK